MQTIYHCKHMLYDSATLYLQGHKGVCVIRQNFNPKSKITWWGPIGNKLATDIEKNKDFQWFFDKYAAPADENGLYPTATVHQVLQLLRMPDTPKKPWETDF